MTAKTFRLLCDAIDLPLADLCKLLGTSTAGILADASNKVAVPDTLAARAWDAVRGTGKELLAIRLTALPRPRAPGRPAKPTGRQAPANGWTQADFAAALGLALRTYVAYETGQSSIPGPVLILARRYLRAAPTCPHCHKTL